MVILGHSRQPWWVSETTADLSRTAEAPRRAQISAAPKNIILDLRRVAILVIDMQNDFCSDGGWLDHIGVDIQSVQSPVGPLNHLLPLLRLHEVPVLWVNWGNREDKMNLSPSTLHVYNPTGLGKGIGDALPYNGSRVLQKGSWGAAIVDELDADMDDIYVDKFRMSGFWDTPLDSILRNLSITTLLFAGVNADQCVLATLQDANFLGYDCILLEDCTATTSPAFCMEATLYNVKQCFGFVTSSRAVMTGIEDMNSREMRIQHG